MSFLTPALLAGIGLIGIPIVLHLAMRREPKKLVFPALRLLKKRRQRNETRLRLRRWLLLALRCLVLAFMAMALARPVLLPPGAKLSATAGGVTEGLGVAMLMDNGPMMGYVSRNQTRLEVAQETADWLLQRFPSETEVVLADRRRWGGTAIDKADGAALRVERIQRTMATRSLGQMASDALMQLDKLAKTNNEFYLFTDLSQSTWDDESVSTIKSLLEERPGLSLQLIDVGVPNPNNQSISWLKLEKEALAVGETARLRVHIESASDQSATRVLQLWVSEFGSDGKPKLVKRDERPIRFDQPTSAIKLVSNTPSKLKQTEMTFSLSGLAEGFHCGVVRIGGTDALAIDDERHFCLQVRSAPRVLLVSNQPEGAVFFREAIAPTLSEPGYVPPYDCKELSFGELTTVKLKNYQAVVLLDPPALDPAAWSRLTQYTSTGGAVVLALGRNAPLGEFNSPAAQRLMPASLKWRSRNATYLRPTNFSHPMLALMSDYAESIPWSLFPVYQYWETDKIDQGAVAVSLYADLQPAIIDQSIGEGRVVLITTPFSDQSSSNDPWNLLPTGEDPWPFVLLANGIAEYGCGLQEAKLNFVAGDIVSVPIPRDLQSDGYVVRTPTGDAVRQTRISTQTTIAIGSTDQIGIHQVESGGWQHSVALNLPDNEGGLVRVDFDELVQELGAEDRVKLVNDRKSLEGSIQQVRVGRELYAWVIGLLALLFIIEQFIASRFYNNPFDGGADAVEV